MRCLLFAAAVTIGTCFAACSLDPEGTLLEQPPGDAGDATARVDGGGGDDRNNPLPDSAMTDGPENDQESGGGAPCGSPPDCSNPACKSRGYVCAPPAPSGWGVVTVDFDAGTSSCPSGGTGYTLYSPPDADAGAECGCSCALGSPPSCVQGNISFTSGGGGGGCGSGPSFKSAADGGCTGTTTAIAPLVQVLEIPGPTGGTCAATPSTKLPPNGSRTDFVCPVDGTASTKGCSGGEVCVAANPGQARCIIEKGTVACAGGYAVSHTLGVGIADSRACTGACTCAAPTGTTCDDQSWTFYAKSGCSGTPFSVDLDGTCDATGLSSSDNAFGSYQYAATAIGATCGGATSTPAPTGSLTLEDPHTVCCLP